MSVFIAKPSRAKSSVASDKTYEGTHKALNFGDAGGNTLGIYSIEALLGVLGIRDN